MELSEYNEELKKITREYDKKKFSLAREYALFHSVAEIGDFVEDHRCKSRVREIRVSMSAPPSCIYIGTELTLAGKPRKDGRIHHCYQSNMSK